MVQISQPYNTTGRTIALTRRIFVGKTMSLFFNMLSALVIPFSRGPQSVRPHHHEPLVCPVDRMWSTGEENGKPLQYSCLENPMNKVKRQNDRILKEELHRSVCTQYAAGDQWRNNSRKNEGMQPSKNNTQLWMGLVIEARSDAVKSNIVQEPEMLGT